MARTSRDLIVTAENLSAIALKNDRCEVRNYLRFLRLYPRYRLRMLASPRWQKYLNITPAEAHRLGKWERLARGVT